MHQLRVSVIDTLSVNLKDNIANVIYCVKNFRYLLGKCYPPYRKTYNQALFFPTDDYLCDIRSIG